MTRKPLEGISMTRLLSLLLGSTALAAMLCQTAAAQEYSNGTGAINLRGRGPATLTPVEAFGVHPPGPDPAYNRKCIFRHWRYTFIPYYAPLSPTASSVRWKPWCYFPLLPWYTPYYCGYCPKRLHNPPPPPYGWNGWGKGPMPDPNTPIPAGTPLNFGTYTSVLQDDTIFWNMGGNGLVPYGTPRPPHNGPPDLVDSIQATRQSGGACACDVPPGDPAATMSGSASPAIQPATEKSTDEKPALDSPKSPK
jgi:hypothetical protein